MITETLDDSMHLPLLIPDGDANNDDDDDNSSSMKGNNDAKITQRQQKIMVLLTVLAILKMIIIGSLDFEKVLLMNLADGDKRFALIVFSNCYTVTYGYLFLGLTGFFFYERSSRTYKKLFYFLTLLLLFSQVVLIVLMSALLVRCQYKVMVGGDFNPI